MKGNSFECHARLCPEMNYKLQANLRGTMKNEWPAATLQKMNFVLGLKY